MEQEFKYYGTYLDGEIRTVYRMVDPTYVFARYADGGWLDAWGMYRRMTKGDGPDPISEAEALAFIAAHPHSGPPLSTPGRHPDFDDRLGFLGFVRAAWATVEVPPGAEELGDSEAARE